MLKVSIAVVALALAPAPFGLEPCGASLSIGTLGAQPRCKKGCACGNSCISCSKTCRITSSRPPEEPVRAPIPQTPTPSIRPLVSGTLSGPWIGSSANRLFFLQACPIARLLPESDRVEVKDTLALSSVGFRRLIVPGC